MAKPYYKFSGLGKRKTAVARVYMNAGDGKFVINKRTLENYFPRKQQQSVVNEPFEVTGTPKKFDVKVRVLGGGPMGQADAVRHGISRALLKADPENRQKLKEAGFLTRDPREKERKKYGQPGARKRFQYSKR